MDLTSASAYDGNSIAVLQLANVEYKLEDVDVVWNLPQIQD